MAAAMRGKLRELCREKGPVWIAQRAGSLSEGVLRKALCCAYATRVAKTASSMIRQYPRHGQRAKDHQSERKKVKHWMTKNPSRAIKMKPETADWPSVFSGPQSYNPAIIPVFLRMGRSKHNKVEKLPPRPLGNLELMKVPNFFHLSPPAIERHCEALKPLCTPWPSHADLTHRPLRITTRNYLFPGPSLYHPGSRKVKLQVFLKDLILDEHARKKLITLVGPRYNPDKDELTVIADRCPTRKQNKDYALYLLTVLYHEAWKTEPWEAEANELNVEEDDEEEKVQKRRKNTKRVCLIGESLFKVNQYGKAFKMQIKVKQ